MHTNLKLVKKHTTWWNDDDNELPNDVTIFLKMKMLSFRKQFFLCLRMWNSWDFKTKKSWHTKHTPYSAINESFFLNLCYIIATESIAREKCVTRNFFPSQSSLMHLLSCFSHTAQSKLTNLIFYIPCFTFLLNQLRTTQFSWIITINTNWTIFPVNN